MALVKCPECGNQVSEMADKCIHCGFPIYMKVSRSIEKKKCSYCGTFSAIYEDVCSSCGARFEETATEENIDMDTMNVTMEVESQDSKTSEEIQSYQFPVYEQKKKNKWIALVLCYFFGMFGAHKFYEGNKKTGKLYLFTFGLLGLGWTVDTISYLLKPETLYNPNAPSEEENKRKRIAIVITIIIVLIGMFMNEKESKTDTEKGTEVSIQIETEGFLF